MRQPHSFDEIRRRALRAAAAAAGLSVLACSSGADDQAGSAAGNGNDVVSAVDTAAQSDTLQTVDSATAMDSSAATDAMTDAGGAAAADATLDSSTAGDIGGEDTAGSAADVASAIDSATTGDAGGCPDKQDGEPDCVALQGKPEWATCCDERMKWCTKQHPGDSKAANTCQFGHNFSGACTGCIPWGPPAPPHFDESWRPRVTANGPVFALT